MTSRSGPGRTGDWLDRLHGFSVRQATADRQAMTAQEAKFGKGARVVTALLGAVAWTVTGWHFSPVVTVIGLTLAALWLGLSLLERWVKP